jgi:hypothetical protein
MFVLLLACAAGVIEEYAKERELALLVATETPSPWSADAVLRLSEGAIEQAVGAALKATVSRDLPSTTLDLPLGQKATLLPHLVVDKVQAAPTDACSPCLSFDGTLLGKVGWTLPPLNGSFPFEVTAAGILHISVGEGQVIQARLKEIKKVQVRILEVGGLSFNPSSTLEKALQRTLLEQLKPVELTRLDPATIPIRDLRMKTTRQGLSVELLTNVPTGQPLPPLPAATGDVELILSEATLLGLARRVAFNQGTLAMEVAADPRVLMVAGDKFTLGLRLWRLVGRGWWRDYTVTGRVSVQDGNIRFKPELVTEGAKSRGAGFVDPMAALVEGSILAAVEKSMRQSLPATRTQGLGGGTRLYSEMTGVEGREGMLIARGKIGILVSTE